MINKLTVHMRLNLKSRKGRWMDKTHFQNLKKNFSLQASSKTLSKIWKKTEEQISKINIKCTMFHCLNFYIYKQ